MAKIYVLHENEEWVTPLGRALDERNIDYANWFLGEGMVNQDKAPPAGVFYNRIGASAHLRGNPYAAQLTGLFLSWLAEHGRRVINDSRALEIEMSKMAQYAALARAGIRTPRTIAAVGPAFVLKAAASFGNRPLILKHNRGGKGHGVVRCDSIEEIERFLESPDYPAPIDGVWLVQEYIQAPEPYIVRCEFVGGKFLYAMRVNTSEGFELCPADACGLRTGTYRFKITHKYDQHPIIKSYESFLKQNQIEIASLEMIRDQEGRLYTYDVNTNTNYNERAEAAAHLPVTGMQAVARYLGRELSATRIRQIA